MQLKRPKRPARFWVLRAAIAAATLSCAVVKVEAAPSPPRAPHWTRHAFALPESIWSVEAIDVNSDGAPDLIAMGVTKVFALVAPDWKARVLLDSKEGKMLYCVAIDAD